MAAAGNKVSSSNKRVGAPRTKPKFGTPRSPSPRKAKRIDYDSMTLDELARQPNLPKKYREAAGLAAARPDYETLDKMKVVGEDGKELTRLELAGQVAEVSSTLLPVGGGALTGARILGKAATVGPKAVRGAKAGAKAAGAAKKAAQSGKAGSRIKNAAKAAPGKAKTKAANAGKKAKRTVATSQGRKQAGKRALQVPRKNPALATSGYVVGADEAGMDNPIIDQAAKDVRGSVKAFGPDNIGDTLQTTKRSIPGILTGVAKPIVAGSRSVGRAAETGLAEAGVPGADKYTAEEIVSPVVDTTKQSVKETGQMLEPFISGSEEDVTRAVKDEIGALPLVFTPKVLGGVRKASKPATRAIRAGNKKRLDKADNKREAKGEARTPRVKDSVDGGEYVIRPLGNLLENRRRRVEWSRQTARGKAAALALTTQELRPIQRAVRQVKAPDGRKTKDYRKSAFDALSTVLIYGIPRNYEAAMARIAKAEAKVGNPNRKTLDRTAVTDRDNFEFLKNNPGIFDDPAFWQGVDLLRKAQDKVTTSEVKRYLAIGVDYGLKTPTERLEEGVEIGGRTVKAKDMDPDLFEKKVQQVKKLRREQRAANKAGDNEAYLEAKGKADKLAEQLRLYNLAAKKARADFVKEAQGVVQREGLETPAYVKSEPGARASLEAAPANPAFNRMAFRTFQDKDKRRQAGEADRSFDALVRSSIYAPRAKRVIHSLITNFALREAIPVQTARGARRYLTSEEIRQAILDGQIDPKQMAVFHSQHFRRGIQDSDVRDVGAFIQLSKRSRSTGGSRQVSLVELGKFDAEIKGRLLDKGHKYIVVRRDAAKEMESQFGSKDNFALKANRFGSRILLGYNPAWAAAQLLAEGLPAAVAIGANPARWARILKSRRKEYDELSPEDRAAVDALAGQSAGVTPVPVPGFESKGTSLPNSSRTKKDRLKQPLAENSNPLTRGDQTAEFLRSVVRGDALGKFDRLKGGGIRKLVVAAQVDKEFNGFMKGLGGVLKLDDELQRKMGAMTLAEKQAAIARNPDLARQMESYLDDVMGNWRAISRLEKGPASLTAFYPFVRYSIKTAFWGFPKRHPFKAAALYFFAQMNANELERFMDGEALDFLNYAYPVTYVDGKPEAAPSATRFTPALSSVVEAVGTDNIRRLLSGINPIIGVGLQGVSGQDTFTGEQVAESWDEHLLLALAAFTSMVGPIRVADSFLNQDADKKYLPSGFRPRRTWEPGDPTTIGGRSKTSMALRELDPGRDWRTAINILGTVPLDDLKKQRAIINDLEAGNTSDLPGSGGSGGSSADDRWDRALSK
jgi:hypothetical protein